MVDIVARLDTAHGEVGPFVPKMNPDLWGLTMDQVTGHPSANSPITGDVRNMQDLTDEEKNHDPNMVGTKTGGSRESKDHREARQAREKRQAAEDASGTKREDGTVQAHATDRHATDIAEGMQSASANSTPATVPEHLQTTQAETDGLMTQKPIQAPALGPDGDGNVANDQLPEGADQDGSGTSKTIQSSPADPSKQTPADVDAASRQALEDAHQSSAANAAHEGDKQASSSKPVPKDLPTKSALMAMSKDDLVAYARRHHVAGAADMTKEEIVEDLHGRG